MAAVTGNGDSENQAGAALLAVAAFDDRVDEAFAPLRGRPLVDRVFYTATIVGEDGRIWLAIAALLALRPASRRKAMRLLVWLGVETVLANLSRSTSR